jgi:hypothetical protein
VSTADGMSRTAPAGWRSWALFTAVSVVASAAAVWALGKSIGVDTYNYEYYAGYAELHGFGSKFQLAGQLQTYQDPQINVLYYALIRTVSPLVVGLCVAALEALPVGLLGFVAVRAAQTAGLGRRTSYALGAVTSALAFIAPNYLLDLGSTYSDTLLLLPILPAVVMLAIEAQKPGALSVRRCCLAGILLGVGALLKLYVLIYAFAIVVGFAVALLRGRTTRSWSTIIAFPVVAGVSTAVSWALLYLPTGKLLWDRYRDPLFPYFNKIFRSPYVQPGNFQDPEYKIRSVGQAVRQFGQLFVGGTGFSVLPFRSPILAVSFLFLLGFLAFDLFFHRDELSLLIEVSMVLSFLLWWDLDYYRYSSVIEMTMPAAVLIVLVRHGVFSRPRSAMTALALVSIVALVGPLSYSARYIRQERTSYRGSYFGPNTSQLAELPSHLLLTTGAPTAFIVPYLAPRTEVVRLGGLLTDVMTDRWWSLAGQDILSQGSHWEIVFDARFESEAISDLHLAHLTGSLTDCQAFPVKLLLSDQNRLRMCAVMVRPA